MTRYIDAKLLENSPEPLRPTGPYLFAIDENLLARFKATKRENDLRAAYTQAGWKIDLIGGDGGSGWNTVYLVNPT